MTTTQAFCTATDQAYPAILHTHSRPLHPVINSQNVQLNHFNTRMLHYATHDLQVFQSGTFLYSIHVTELISCTFCEIASTKITVLILFRYDNNTGIFHCDQPGLYYFEIYWAKHPDFVMTLHMYKNGIEICRCTGYNYATDYTFPSCSAPVDLVPGDRVWVVSNLQGQFGSPPCSGFTGFLVTPYF